MLYCPKCQATYEDGTQRFCTNEGARLLSSPSTEQSGQSSKGVFTSILGKSFSKPENIKSEAVVSAFKPPIKSKFFSAEKEDEAIEKSKPTVLEINNQEKETKQTKPFEHIPLASIIKPNLIQEKQRKSDIVFDGETKKSVEISAELSDKTETKEEVLQSFDINNQDFLEVEDSENLILSEDVDENELSADSMLDHSETSAKADEFELNIENQETDVIDLGSELELDSVENIEIPKSIESNSNFDLDLDEPLEGLDSLKLDSDFEIDVEDLDKIPVNSEPLPQGELDLGDLDEFSIPSKVELDLESKEEINLADSMPRIELDLADLDDVSIPDKLETEPDVENEGAKTGDSIELKTFPPREIKYEISEILQSSLPPVVSNIGEESEIKQEIGSEKKEEKTVSTEAGTEKIKATDDPTWEKRSSEAAGGEESKWFLYPLIGLIILALGLLGFFYLTNQNNSVNREPANKLNENLNQPNINANVNLNANDSQTNINTNDSQTNINTNVSDSSENLNEPSSYPGEPNLSGEPRSDLSAVPPLPRTISQPPNTVLYKNVKKQQKGVQTENFLGFSIYYPKDWKETKSDNKFLDIAKKTPEGLPIKQLLITRYDSNGTFDADRTLFDELVKKSNADLRGILSNYEVINEGETIFQNGRWRVYQVTFQGIGSDKKLIIWGRRLWLPVQRAGMKSGFIITVFGTSLSDDIKSVNDLENDDEITEILKTFEPELN